MQHFLRVTVTCAYSHSADTAKAEGPITF